MLFAKHPYPHLLRRCPHSNHWSNLYSSFEYLFSDLHEVTLKHHKGFHGSLSGCISCFHANLYLTQRSADFRRFVFRSSACLHSFCSFCSNKATVAVQRETGLGPQQQHTHPHGTMMWFTLCQGISQQFSLESQISSENWSICMLSSAPDESFRVFTAVPYGSEFRALKRRECLLSTDLVSLSGWRIWSKQTERVLGSERCLGSYHTRHTWWTWRKPRV